MQGHPGGLGKWEGWGEAPKGPRQRGKEGRRGECKKTEASGGNLWLYCGRAVQPPSLSLHLDRQFPCQVVRSKYLCAFVSNIGWFTVCDVAGGFGCCWLHKRYNPECVLRTWQVKSGFLYKPPRCCSYDSAIKYKWWCWWLENKMREKCKQLYNNYIFFLHCSVSLSVLAVV